MNALRITFYSSGRDLMGCVQSGNAKPEESKRIDDMLRQEQKTPPNTKVLLLGTGEAGKTYVRCHVL